MKRSELKNAVIGIVFASWLFGFLHLFLMPVPALHSHCMDQSQETTLCKILLDEISRTSLFTVAKIVLFLLCTYYIYSKIILPALRQSAYRKLKHHHPLSYLEMLFTRGILNPKAP